MMTTTLRLNSLPGTFVKEAVVTVYFKNRTNIIGTCTLQQSDTGSTGLFTVAEELHDNLVVLYLYSSKDSVNVFEGVLLDDPSGKKDIDTVGTNKLS